MRPHARTFRTLSNLDFPVVWIMWTESRRGFWENLKGYYDTIRKWFPQHKIAGLISGITFIVLFQSGEASTVEGNKHTHTRTQCLNTCWHELFVTENKIFGIFSTPLSITLKRSLNLAKAKRQTENRFLPSL